MQTLRSRMPSRILKSRAKITLGKVGQIDSIDGMYVAKFEQLHRNEDA